MGVALVELAVMEFAEVVNNLIVVDSQQGQDNLLPEDNLVAPDIAHLLGCLVYNIELDLAERILVAQYPFGGYRPLGGYPFGGYCPLGG